MDRDFDGWLEDELGARYQHLASAPPPGARYLAASTTRRWTPMRPLSTMSAVLGAKALAGLAVVTVAAAGVGAKTVATGDPNPLNWGQKVEDQVTTCQNALSSGQHGIGDCVSDFAKQNGANHRSSHSSSDNDTATPTPGTEGKSDVNSNNGTEGRSDSHPTPGASPGTSGRSDTHPTPDATSTSNPSTTNGQSTSHPTPPAH